MVKTDSLGRRRRRKPGDILQLKRILWGVLLEVEELAADEDPQVRLKAANTLAQLSGPYLNAIRVSDVEARLAAVERQLNLTQPTNGHSREVYR